MKTPEPARKHPKHINRWGLGLNAPSKDLPFPTGANLTAVELLTFLPKSIHSVDVIYRFASNGGARNAVWVIVNTCRDLPERWLIDRCGSEMYKTMRNAGYARWTVTTHANWHDARKETWDETDLDVTNFRTPSQVEEDGQIALDIPFKELATGVRALPKGYDALDLTRMVQYCVKNPDDHWMYPSDYGKLLKHLGGPATVCPEHFDRAAFSRWQNATAPPPRVWSQEELEVAKTPKYAQTELGTKRKRVSSFRGDTPISFVESREAIPTAVYQQQKRATPRRQRVTEHLGLFPGAEAMHEEGTPQTTEYVRRPAEYVAPSEIAVTPASAAVAFAFMSEGAVGESSPYGAYAFSGPRQQTPYRMLHDIAQPDPGDTTGWAENLRWALEQRSCFWHTNHTVGWNESPEHMERIANVRQNQVWASDELLIQLQEFWKSESHEEA